MIKQLQMGIKLLRYTHGIVANTALGALILLVGIIMELGSSGSTGMSAASLSVGGYFILMTAMWPLQMLISLNVPGIVAASPWKKRIQTSVFSVSAVLYFTLTYTLVMVLKLMKWKSGLVSEEQFVIEMLQMVVFVFILMIYMTTSLKYFVVSTIIFCIVLPTFMVSYMIAYNMDILARLNLGPGAIILIGYVTIFISALLGNGILHLLYKKPVSKYSQMSGLRKKM